jgi:transposase InsO family protein
LTVSLDLFDRKVIGWALSADMETCHTIIPALEMAIRNRVPQTGLIFHSDRGIQYCTKSFREKLTGCCPLQDGLYAPDVHTIIFRKFQTCCIYAIFRNYACYPLP